jgi:VWFA-related protein
VKDVFQLFDERQPQVISRFSVETNQTGPNPNNERATSTPANREKQRAASTVERDLAYVFDDLHLNVWDLEKARKAARKHLAELRVGDRAAIFATSGKVALGFTDEQKKLQSALSELKPRGREAENCPPMSYYEAYLIVNQGDKSALDMAAADALACMFKGGGENGPQVNIAARTARAKATEIEAIGHEESQIALRVLQDVMARTSAMSGRRSVVLISPGFPILTEEAQAEAMNLIESALRSDIVVNVLDVTGLQASSMDASADAPTLADRIQFDAREGAVLGGLISDLAYGTGGLLVHGDSDMNEGLRHAADVPEYIYVLGFSPQKLDGKFHKLKVTLNTTQKLNVQARRGYYALKPGVASAN